jgi:hypothetical protein
MWLRGSAVKETPILNPKIYHSKADFGVIQDLIPPFFKWLEFFCKILNQNKEKLPGHWQRISSERKWQVNY